MALAYELLFGRRPPILTKVDERLPRLKNIKEHALKVARLCLRKMLRDPTMNRTSSLSETLSLSGATRLDGWYRAGSHMSYPTVSK